MPRRPKGSVPSLVHHKPSGRARVRINGRDHWLGKWGSPEARLAYDRLIADYLASGGLAEFPSRSHEESMPLRQPRLRCHSTGLGRSTNPMPRML